MNNFTITHIGDTELSQPMPFIFIEAAVKEFEFQAPEDSNRGNKGNSEKITFKDNYYLCAYPTTQEFWEAVVTASGTKELNPLPSRFKGKSRPVEQVSWDDLQVFNKLLNELIEKRSYECIETGANKTKVDIKGEFGLPSESQWEYAADANQEMVFAGSQNLNDVGWYDKNSNNQTMPVGLKQVNGWGIYDIGGNVWEWCADGYADDIGEIPKNGEPYLKTTRIRSLRGGGFFNFAVDCRLRNRYFNRPDFRNGFSGFRLRFSPSS